MDGKLKEIYEQAKMYSRLKATYNKILEENKSRIINELKEVDIKQELLKLDYDEAKNVVKTLKGIADFGDICFNMKFTGILKALENKKYPVRYKKICKLQKLQEMDFLSQYDINLLDVFLNSKNIFNYEDIRIIIEHYCGVEKNEVVKEVNKIVNFLKKHGVIENAIGRKKGTFRVIGKSNTELFDFIESKKKEGK